MSRPRYSAATRNVLARAMAPEDAAVFLASNPAKSGAAVASGTEAQEHGAALERWLSAQHLTAQKSGVANIRKVGPPVVMGSGGILYLDGATDHPGIIRLDNTAASGSGIWMGFAASGGNGSAKMVNWYDLYNRDWDLAWSAKVTTTSTIRFRAGFDNGMSYGGSLTSASMWIRYDTSSPFSDNAKASGAGAWVAQICGYDDSGTTCTASDTAGLTAQLGGTPDTNWHKFRIYRTGGKIYFQVDSNTAKTACLAAGGCDMTLPPNPGSGLTNYVTTPALIWTAEATGSKSAYVDYAKFKMSGLTR
jgi:hypothetical protein